MVTSAIQPVVEGQQALVARVDNLTNSQSQTATVLADLMRRMERQEGATAVGAIAAARRAQTAKA